ncbi:MAG: hypothetical protein AAFO89_07675 [Planctomycetota bacterium]
MTTEPDQSDRGDAAEARPMSRRRAWVLCHLLRGLRVGGVVAACVWLGGCGSRVIARERPAVIADAGQGWQLVLESGAAGSYASADRPELTRRNDNLNLVTTQDRLDAQRFDTLTRPTLERSRRLFLDDDARFPTYYLPPRRSYRR